LATQTRTGTQAIERATQMLCVLAERGRGGWRISDIAARAELPLATCHRILNGLVRQRLAMHLPGSARYAVGPLITELAASRPAWLDLPGDTAPMLRQLARRHRAVTFLYARSGDDFVCLVRENGVVMRALAIERGTRRPLVTSAGGAAILVQLPEDERRDLVRANMAKMAAFAEQRISGIRSMLRASAECGYGLNLGWVVAGVHAVGLAVCDPVSAEPLGAVVISGSPERLPLQRIEAIVPQLRSAAGEVAQIWTGSGPQRAEAGIDSA
jgi:DNA-binding IclR family transcriptional regulator